MNVHEYQAKELLRSYGVPVPNGIAAFTVEEAVDASEQLSGPIKVVKAQIRGDAVKQVASSLRNRKKK